MSMHGRGSHRIGLVVVACLAAAVALAGPHKDFADLSETWEAKYNAGDAAAVAALYTEDGWVMPPNTEAAHGRQAIQTKIEQDLAANEGSTLAIESVESGKDGNVGFARGTYTFTDADGNVIDRGKWVEVRKKVAGQWLIHCDIWNSDMPM